MRTPAPGSQFGYSVAYVLVQDRGSMFGGVLVGAPFFDPGNASAAGKVFLFLAYPNQAQLNTTPQWSYAGTQAYEHVGWSVADGGLLNPASSYTRYGMHSLLVGAPGYTQNYTAEGAVFAFYPKTLQWTYGPTPDWTATGNQAWANLGSCVSGAVDLNDDTYHDVVVGAPSFSEGGKSCNGEVLVYAGLQDGPALNPSWWYYGVANNQVLGTAIATGDFNGDGRSDVAVGGPGAYAGAAYVFLNNAADNLHFSPDTTLLGEANGDLFGASLASGFDQNRDGMQDLLVGAPEASTNSLFEVGKVYLYRGNATGVSSPPAWVLGGFNNDYAYFGTSVAGGDFNGDGYGDIFIGAPGYSAGNPASSGRMLCFLSSTTPPYTPYYDGSDMGLCNYEATGQSLSFAPLLINPPAGNIIVGAPGSSTCPGVHVLKHIP